jgi:hypothetical protein
MPAFRYRRSRTLPPVVVIRGVALDENGEPLTRNHFGANLRRSKVQGVALPLSAGSISPRTTSDSSVKAVAGSPFTWRSPPLGRTTSAPCRPMAAWYCEPGISPASYR